LKWTPPPLYAICDADVCERAGWTVLDLASAFLQGGARLLQIRAKHQSSRWLLETTVGALRRAEPAGGLVVVNDRADVARLAGAGGVHVGQDDLDPQAVRTIVGPAAVIGLSTHTAAQIDAALSPPVNSLNYLAMGPVFNTTTKPTSHDAVGLDRVREAAAKAVARGLPLVAIGGITLERAAAVLEAGAQSVAVITDLLSTGDPEARVRAYLDRLSLLSSPTRRRPRGLR
jgi:thiamine-phosphate pyrophosphorylase